MLVLELSWNICEKLKALQSSFIRTHRARLKTAEGKVVISSCTVSPNRPQESYLNWNVFLKQVKFTLIIMAHIAFMS